MKIPYSIDRAFWNRVIKSPGCWIFNGPVAGKGYGSLRWAGKQQYAHRLSFEMHIGPIKKGLFVLHRCDNPPCVNPAHLFLGTNQDNMDDMVAKGRANGHFRTSPIVGEMNPRAVLTEKMVRNIRDSIGRESPTDIAKRLGVKRCSVYHVVYGHTWRHVV